MTDTIVSLTTIPPRFETILPTLESLLSQKADIAEIQLWIPRTYRRPEFRDFTAPKLPKGVAVMYCEEDLGPATKILPAAEHYKGQDIRIIYCDDDEYYEQGWADLLIRSSDQYPAECITICGLNLDSVENAHFMRSTGYRLLNVLTLNFYRRAYRTRQLAERPGIGPVDICQGFGGVLVKPAFFPASADQIPDVLWTVDDIWLSGQMRSNGVTIRRVSERKMCSKTSAAGVADLTNYSYGGHDRISADMLCVNHFRKVHGIWQS